jgi:hypothetical protein
MPIADRIAAVTRAKPKPSEAKKKADERRWAQRKPGLMGALIAYHPVKPPVDCIIRDMSATGARIEIGGAWGEAFNSAEDVPDHVTLLMRLDKTEVDCEVVWRRTKQFGVRFRGGMRPLSRKLSSRNEKPAAAAAKKSLPID